MMKMNSDKLCIWTIGHSNQPLDQFLSLLHQHEIKTLVDIRRFPASRKYPHFSRDNLSISTADREIAYHWLEGLGGRRSGFPDSLSENVLWQNKSFRNYADYMQTEEFRVAFDKLVRLSTQDRTAMMCSESVFWRCHRRLVSDYAVAFGRVIEHIFPGGQSKLHQMTEGSIIKSRDPVILAYPGESQLSV